MPFELIEGNLGNLTEPVALIIDDEFTSRVILNKIVCGIHHNIVVNLFSDPLAGMEWARVNRPDLVIVDYVMNGISGIEVVRGIRRIPHLEDVPIVMVTASEDTNVRYQALEEGATDFILKPIDPHECHTRHRNQLSLRLHQRALLERAQSLEQAV